MKTFATLFAIGFVSLVSAGIVKADEAGNQDKSGTDPTKFLPTITLRNDFIATTNNDYVNTFNLIYIHPFQDRLNLRTKLPIVATDIAGDGDFGIGDLSLRLNWLAHVDQQKGILLGFDSKIPTATDDVLGGEKWVISPLITYAWFINKNTIFAPSYQHDFSFAGDDDRADVNQSVFDLYFVFTSDDKKQFIQVDPQIILDWENDKEQFIFKTTFGQRVGSLWGGAVNFTVAPSVGIGNDRPYDWGVEVGLTVVGF
jgi:hypothetical protein